MKFLIYFGFFFCNLLPTISHSAILVFNPKGTYTTENDLATTVAAAEMVEKTISITSTVIVDNVTVPSTIALKVEKGGILMVNSGKTLTINGPFEAGLHQVFAGSGTVSFGAGSVKEVYPEWKGTATADIQAMINAAPYGVPVQFTAANYNITGILSLKSGTRLVSHGSWLSGTVDNKELFFIDIDKVSDVKISGFQLTRGDHLVTNSKCGIHITNGSSRIEIFDNYFYDMYIGAVSQLETATNSHINIHDNLFQTMGTLGVGINNRGTTGVRIQNNTFSHCGYNQPGYRGGVIGAGVEIRGNTGTIVTGNQFYNGTDNLYPNDGVRVENVSEAPTYPGSHNIVSNNVMDTIAGNGVRIIESSGTLVEGNQIRNISTTAKGGSGYSGNGVLISTSGQSGLADKTQIANNHIENTANGIQIVNGTVSYTQITNNTILTSTEHGIYGNFKYSQIGGNKVRGASNISCVRLGVDGGNNLVENNDVSDGSADYGGITIGSNNNIIQNNYVWDSRTPVIHNYGIYVAAATGNQLLNNVVRDFNTNRIFLEAKTSFANTTLSHKVPVPSSKTSTCNKGDWASNTTYLYLAAPTDQFTFNWKRVKLDNAAW